MARSFIMLSAVVVGLGLFGAASAEANNHKNNPGNGSRNSSFTSSSSGMNHNQKRCRLEYSKRCWFSSCNCYCYWCDSCWYYWSEKDCCYYPMSEYPAGM
jgi:hypothetical protein